MESGKSKQTNALLRVFRPPDHPPPPCLIHNHGCRLNSHVDANSYLRILSCISILLLLLHTVFARHAVDWRATYQPDGSAPEIGYGDGYRWGDGTPRHVEARSWGWRIVRHSNLTCLHPVTEWHVDSLISRFIYRDAFAPQTTQQHHKPWDRAPVTSHAPRLAGRKIWKKASSARLTAAASEDKENAARVEVELEKGGNGSRKRARALGVRENIGMPGWLAPDANGEEGGLGAEDALGSPRKKGAWDDDALLVPRKRTSANRLVTPRKALARKEGNVAGAVVHALAMDIQDSMEKMTIPPNKFEGASVKELPRKRKSMRQSRRLTMGDLVEEGTEAGLGDEAAPRRDSFDFTSKLEERVLETDVPIAVKEIGCLSATPPQSLTAVPLLDDIQTLQPVLSHQDTSSERVLIGHDEQKVTDVEITECETRDVSEEASIHHQDQDCIHEKVVEEVIEMECSVSEQGNVPIPENDSNLADAAVSHEDKETVEDVEDVLAVQNANLTTTEEQEYTQSPRHQTPPVLSISEQHPQTPTQTSYILTEFLTTTEPDKSTEIASPVKFLQTPRSKKTPQGRGTRRSMRNMRTSSATLEETLVPAAQQTVSQELVPAQTVLSRLPSISDKTVLQNSIEVEVEPASDVAEMISEGADVVVHESSSSLVELPSAIKQGHQPVEIVNASSLEAVSVEPEDAESIHEQQIHAPVSSEIVDEQASASEGAGFLIDEAAIAEQARREESLLQDSDAEGDIKTSTSEPAGDSDADPFSPSTLETAPVLSNDTPDATLEEAETIEFIKPISTASIDNVPCSPMDEASEELHESSTPYPATTELIETISENTIFTTSEHDDTNMLRDFLSRVKANKAAQAKTSIPKRKRSLPHSPIQIPLETVEAFSPSASQPANEFDLDFTSSSPSKRRKRSHVPAPVPEDEEIADSKSIRRSGRTRLPVKTAPIAPSFIPVRRFGQDGDNTVTLRRSEDKELAALTKFNTRKNKGAAKHPADFLYAAAKKAEENEGLAARQKVLKEAFDEREREKKRGKGGRKSVVWAEELTRFQGDEKWRELKEGEEAALPPKLKENKANSQPTKEEKKSAAISVASTSVVAAGEKKTSVQVGVRSKMTLGMAANGTPAPRRKMRERS